jgi:hypothetical protein
MASIHGHIHIQSMDRVAPQLFLNKIRGRKALLTPNQISRVLTEQILLHLYEYILHLWSYFRPVWYYTLYNKVVSFHGELVAGGFGA